MSGYNFDLSVAEFPNGQYDFIIAEAKEHISEKSGNTCLKLKLSCTDPEYAGAVVDKYIVIEKADGTAPMLGPIRQLAKSMGDNVASFTLGDVENGEFTRFKGCNVRAQIENQADQDGFPRPQVKALLPKV